MLNYNYFKKLPNKISLVLSILLIVNNLALSQTHNISIDYNQVIGSIRSLQQINGGPMGIKYDLPNLDSQFTAVGFDYVRLHDILRGADTSSIIRPWDIDHIFPNFSADPTLAINYNFADADSQISAILSVGAKPLIRLGYSYLSPTKYVAPADQAKWAEICKHVIMHYNDGFANGFNYGFNYVEIWNEPNESNQWFWTGTDNEFYTLYDTTAKILKAYDSNLIVGGPGTAGVPSTWLNGFLTHCKVNNVPLDFLSWHTYDDPDALNPYAFYYQANKAQQFLNLAGFTTTKSLLTEWSTALHASSLSYDAKGAAYTTSALTYLQNSSVAMAFRFRANTEDTTGRKLGLWYPDGRWKKPAYSFLAFKKLLDTPIRISTTGSDTLGYTTIAGKSTSGDTITILISDFGSLNTTYSLDINNLPADSFSLQRYVVDSLNDFILEESKVISVTDFPILRSMKSPSFQLLRLIKKDTLISTLANLRAKSQKLICYPNPFEEETTIFFNPPVNNCELKLYNVFGQEVGLISRIRGNSHIIHKNNLKRGVYFIKLQQHDKVIGTNKIIIF